MAPHQETLDVSAALALAQSKFKSTEVERAVPFVLDLGNLTAYDVNVVPDSACFRDKGLPLETFLRENTRDGVQALINQLWDQPTRPSPDGTTILAALPEPNTLLPRAKPLPKPKPPTRWERFAKEKGIHKTKKSRLVWSEQEKDWVPAWGYQGANNQEDWLLEVPENADPMEDQYEKKSQEKKERVAKNKKQQLRNLELTGAPAANDPKLQREQQKQQLRAALVTTKTSTASLGKFDKKVEGEEKVKLRREKRQFDAVADNLDKEKEMATKILKKVVGGEPVLDTEKGVRKMQAREDRKRSLSTGPGANKKYNKKSRK